MSGTTDGRRGPYLRLLRRAPAAPACAPLAPLSAVETPASLLPATPRVAALDALLRDVAGLRRTLETDLSLAASALDAGATRLAGEILDSDRHELNAFERRALGHLAELAGPAPAAGPAAAPARPRRRLLLPASPFVAAAALIGFAIGVLPSHLSGSGPEPVANTAASSTLSRLSELAATGGSPTQVNDAAATLHNQLAPLVAQGHRNPLAVQQALVMLRSEQEVLQRGDDSPALRSLLLQSRQLSRELLAVLSPAARRVARPVTAVLAPTATPSPRPGTARPAPKPATSTRPAATTASPRPTSSAAPAPTSPLDATSSPQPAPNPSLPGR